MVVIAGPNGCGKSCILDAIRLAKSAYGAYDTNEFRNWFGEFQLDPNSPTDMKKVLRNKTKSAQIRVRVSLHTLEAEYLRSKAEEIGERTAVSIFLPGVVFEEWRQRLQASGQHAQQLFSQIENLANSISKILKLCDANTIQEGVLDIRPDGNIGLAPNPVLQAVWSIYEPKSVGIVDYHGPQRHFSRENVGQVHLSLKTQEQGQKQSVLYNYTNKYTNIKTQMATEFVINALRQHGDNSQTGRQLLSETLQELFKRFFLTKVSKASQRTNLANWSLP